MKKITFILIAILSAELNYSQSNVNDTTMITPNFSQTPKVQGRGEMIINAPVEKVWPLIRDSND